MGKQYNRPNRSYQKPDVTDVVEEPKIGDKVVVEEVKAVTVGTIKEIKGKVDGVDSFLNVRRDPKVAANNIVALLEKGKEVLIVDESHSDFYEIKVEDANPVIHGYAMKKYIKKL